MNSAELKATISAAGNGLLQPLIGCQYVVSD